MNSLKLKLHLKKPSLLTSKKINSCKRELIGKSTLKSRQFNCVQTLNINKYLVRRKKYYIYVERQFIRTSSN